MLGIGGNAAIGILPPLAAGATDEMRRLCFATIFKFIARVWI